MDARGGESRDINEPNEIQVRCKGVFFERKKKHYLNAFLGDDRLSSISADCAEEIRGLIRETTTLLQTNPRSGTVGCPTEPYCPVDTAITFGVIAAQTRHVVDLVTRALQACLEALSLFGLPRAFVELDEATECILCVWVVYP